MNAGITGKLNSKWDTHIGISAFWFNHTKAIEAEVAQDILGRVEAATGFTGLFDPRANNPKGLEPLRGFAEGRLQGAVDLELWPGDPGGQLRGWLGL